MKRHSIPRQITAPPPSSALLRKLLPLALASAFSLLPSALLHAATTIDAANHFAYGANIGWMDWRGNTTDGAVIGEYVCSGYIYAANAGWINLGSGSPTNGIFYQNTSGSDFGVNQDGYGNLSGYAWGANVGWIAFESTGAPKVDLATGNLSGYVWSANCGWISLSNAVARVQTDSIQQGTLAPNGLPIAWLLLNFGTTNISANADPTGKGMTITQDYLAGTDPNNSNDVFRITSVARAGDQTTLDWSSKSNRAYYVQFTPSLSPASWTSVSTNGLDVSTVSLAGRTNTDEFYRVGAFRPLGP